MNYFSNRTVPNNMAVPNTKNVPLYKQITEFRKQNNLNEAYRLSLELLHTYRELSLWDVRAVLWTVVSLIKRSDVKDPLFNEYVNILQNIDKRILTPDDTVLINNINFCLNKSNPFFIKEHEASELSKKGEHQKALSIFQDILNNAPNPTLYHLGYAWCLYRYSKDLLSQEIPNTKLINQNLINYSNLLIEKPSIIHSQFLFIAYEIADSINLSQFVSWWNLDYLRNEYFIPYTTKEGKVIAPFAIRVLQKVSKSAIDTQNIEFLSRLPKYLDIAINRYADNIWLQYYKIKILLILNEYDIAEEQLVKFIKIKNNEFWSWHLLANIYERKDDDIALSCYCKALSCSEDINYIQNLKIEFAKFLCKIKLFDRAKIEVLEVVNYKSEHNQKIDDELNSILNSEWYKQTTADFKDNKDYYLSNKDKAESIIFANLQFIDAMLGESFIKADTNKKRYKLYLKNDGNIATEVSIPENKLYNLNLQKFDNCRIKGEFNDRRFDLYIIEKRNDAKKFDIFTKRIGVIDNINKEKNVVHILFNTREDSVVFMDKLDFDYEIGSLVYAYLSHNEKRLNVVHVEKALDVDLDISYLIKDFKGICSFVDGKAFAFVDDVFIASDLFLRHPLSHEKEVSGRAILSFDKKRGQWGWKAISIDD